MTDHAQKNLRSFSAFLLKETGVYFPETDAVLPALYVFNKGMELNNQTNREIAAEIKEVASRINPTVFNFNSGDAAAKFQKGITLRWMLVGILSLILVWGAVMYRSITNDLARASIIIESAPNVDEMLKQVKKDKEGYYYFDFTAANGNSIQTFKEFQKINSRTVRVYLGKDVK